MNEYCKQTFKLGEDLIIDLHYNPNLFKSPHLLRLFSWNDYSELCFDKVIELMKKQRKKILGCFSYPQLS